VPVNNKSTHKTPRVLAGGVSRVLAPSSTTPLAYIVHVLHTATVNATTPLFARGFLHGMCMLCYTWPACHINSTRVRAGICARRTRGACSSAATAALYMYMHTSLYMTEQSPAPFAGVVSVGFPMRSLTSCRNLKYRAFSGYLRAGKLVIKQVVGFPTGSSFVR